MTKYAIRTTSRNGTEWWFGGNVHDAVQWEANQDRAVLFNSLTEANLKAIEIGVQKYDAVPVDGDEPDAHLEADYEDRHGGLE